MNKDIRKDIKKDAWQGGLKNKPDWDTYFMSLAFLASQRSIDENTCHGAIVVDWRNRLISQGYNGPKQYLDDSKIPTSGPDKYKHFIHAEVNAIRYANNTNAQLSSCRIYVTGLTCLYCAGQIHDSGMKNVICGSVKSKMIDEKSVKLVEDYYTDNQIKLTYYKNIDNVRKLLDKTYKYIDYKEL